MIGLKLRHVYIGIHVLGKVGASDRVEKLGLVATIEGRVFGTEVRV